MNIDVSIIVPVYNVEKYLRDCLESLVNQSIESKEVIIVNDCSTDNSMLIIDEYVKKYNNLFRVINLKENAGLSNARNVGIEAARGNYIGFVDSDDYVDINMFKNMHELAVSEKCDMVVCKFQFCDENSTYESSKNIKLSNRIIKLNNFETMRKILKDEVSVASWNKLYDKRLFENCSIRYPKGMYYEDMSIIYKILNNSKNIILIEDEFYFYRRRKNSISRRLTHKNLEDYKTAIDEIYAMSSNIIDNSLKDELEAYNIKQRNTLARMYANICIINNNKFDYEYVSNYLYGNIRKYSVASILPLDLSKKEVLKFILIKLRLYHLGFRFKNMFN